MKPGIGTDELAALLALMTPLPPPSSAALSAEYDRGHQGERREDPGCLGCCPEFCTNVARPLLGKRCQRVLGGRLSQGGLNCRHGDVVAEAGVSLARARLLEYQRPNHRCGSVGNDFVCLILVI